MLTVALTVRIPADVYVMLTGMAAASASPGAEEPQTVSDIVNQAIARVVLESLTVKQDLFNLPDALKAVKESQEDGPQ